MDDTQTTSQKITKVTVGRVLIRGLVLLVFLLAYITMSLKISGSINLYEGLILLAASSIIMYGIFHPEYDEETSLSMARSLKEPYQSVRCSDISSTPFLPRVGNYGGYTP